jgi:tetratricopeptide (TPR) repeat protein
VPGHLVTLAIERRWTWRGDEYASGRIENPRIAVEKLGLVPLPLTGGELHDLRAAYEPFRSPELYAPMWRKLTAKPRAWFEMDPIAWGAFPGLEPDEDPTCDAAELAASGDRDGARELLMELLCTDLRCIDAHAHLGNLEFDRAPQRAIVHYEIGIRIGELSLPPGFDGVLAWGDIYNRPFLRCLHGYGLCFWRLGRLREAQEVFERILSLNPNDNQGVRSCWDDVRHGRSWADPDVPRGASEPDGSPALH